MTKKHFIALADHLKYSSVKFTPEQIGVLAAFCEAQNPNFDRARWLNYIDGKCGPNGGSR